MADTKVVTIVDRAQGAQGDAKDVQRDIVHENADSQAPSAMQKATEAVAQGVQKVKDAVVGEADHSAPPPAEATGAAAAAHDHMSRV